MMEPPTATSDPWRVYKSLVSSKLSNKFGITVLIIRSESKEEIINAIYWV